MYNVKAFFHAPKVAGPSVVTSAADIQEFLVPSKVRVRRILATVSTAVVSTGSVVITVYSRPTVGSSSSQVTLGTLTVPAASVAGATFYKDLSTITSAVKAGQSVAFAVTTAAAGTGAAGAVYCTFEAEEDPETASNQSNLTASA